MTQKDKLVGCIYTKRKEDGYHAEYTTSCGREVYIAVPETIGIAFAPPPNADGKFCSYCGKEIVVFSERIKP